MVAMISDAPYKDGKRVVSFVYELNNDSDKNILKGFDKLCETQKRCDNCKNFYREGCLGGYRACCCRIHGCLEVCGHPHYDMDGSKCNDYLRIL